MAAYVIYQQTEITDPDLYREYIGIAGKTVTKYGGRRLAGAEVEILEGEWAGSRVIIHEFPDMEALKRWHGSEEFRPLIVMRQRAAKGNLIAVEGL